MVFPNATPVALWGFHATAAAIRSKPLRRMPISAAIIDLVQARRRFGYRRIHDMLRPVFPGINHKRIYRLYIDANMAVRKRKMNRP